MFDNVFDWYSTLWIILECQVGSTRAQFAKEPFFWVTLYISQIVHFFQYIQGDPEKTLFSDLCSTWGSRMIHRVEYQSKTFPNIVFDVRKKEDQVWWGGLIRTMPESKHSFFVGGLPLNCTMNWILHYKSIAQTHKQIYTTTHLKHTHDPRTCLHHFWSFLWKVSKNSKTTFQVQDPPSLRMLMSNF